MVTLSASGMADSRAHAGWMLNLLSRHTSMAAQYEDHDVAGTEVKASSMPFVLVRPMRLVDGNDKTEIKYWGDQGKGVRVFTSILRANVARFHVDAAESDEWNDRTPVISN